MVDSMFHINDSSCPHLRSTSWEPPTHHPHRESMLQKRAQCRSFVEAAFASMLMYYKARKEKKEMLDINGSLDQVVRKTVGQDNAHDVVVLWGSLIHTGDHLAAASAGYATKPKFCTALLHDTWFDNRCDCLGQLSVPPHPCSPRCACSPPAAPALCMIRQLDTDLVRVPTRQPLQVMSAHPVRAHGASCPLRAVIPPPTFSRQASPRTYQHNWSRLSPPCQR